MAWTIRRPPISAGSVSSRAAWPRRMSASSSAPTATNGISTPICSRSTPKTPLKSISRSPGLLKDLKARGLLKDTLVIWSGEFGRTPVSESGDGRDHNPYGYSIWMAGGGVKPGFAYGATDEFGYHAVENRMHIHDFHATVLALMGLDH